MNQQSISNPQVSSMTTAKDIMTPDVLSVYEGWSIKRAAEFFVKHGISGAPVIASDHALVGVLSITDIVRFDSMANEDKASLIASHVYPEYLGQNVDKELFNQLANNADQNCTVNTIMTGMIISVDMAETVPEVASLMDHHKIRRVFVTDNGLIAGVISTGNILRFLASMK